MKKIIIDRKIWLRGKKLVDQTGDSFQRASMLYRPLDKRMCCIGIYLNQCGISKQKLFDRPDTVALVDDFVRIPKQAKWLINTERGGDIVYTNNSKDAGHLMTVNDGTANEKTIKRMFAKHDVEIEFVGRS